MMFKLSKILLFSIISTVHCMSNDETPGFYKNVPDEIQSSSSSSASATASQSTAVESGVTSFALPAEERIMTVDSYYLANINFTYWLDDVLKYGGGEIGKFGEGKVLNVSGPLVHVSSMIDGNNHTACYSRFNMTNVPVVRWIALIRRGYCNFEIKVKHAFNHGAVGAIIYNDRDVPNLDKMKIEEKERYITSVFVSLRHGEEMAKLIEKGYQVNVTIMEGRKGVNPLGNVNRTSVLFVSISFIVLMIISLVWLVFYYIQRFRYLQTKDKQSRRLCNVAKRIISKIPTKSIKTEDKDSDSDCCAICIEPYRISELIRVLPCKHEFHRNCIDPWLLEHRTCPMCKMDILKHYGFVFTGSQESILQLDLDADDIEGDAVSMPSPRSDGVSPLPQIRSQMDSQRYNVNIPIESDSDREQMSSSGSISSPNETTPSLRNNKLSSDNQQQQQLQINPQYTFIRNVGDDEASTPNHHDDANNDDGEEEAEEEEEEDNVNAGGDGKTNADEICVGCIAATLIKNNDFNFDNSNSDSSCSNEKLNEKFNQTGSSSLPSTLKKYKGNHSTGSCRGVPNHNSNNNNSNNSNSSNNNNNSNNTNTSRKNCDNDNNPNNL